MLLLLAFQSAESPLRFAAFSGVFFVLAVSCLLVATVLVIRDLRRGSVRVYGSPALWVCYGGVAAVVIAAGLLLAGV